MDFCEKVCAVLGSFNRLMNDGSFDIVYGKAHEAQSRVEMIFGRKALGGRINFFSIRLFGKGVKTNNE